MSDLFKDLFKNNQKINKIKIPKLKKIISYKKFSDNSGIKLSQDLNKLKELKNNKNKDISINSERKVDINNIRKTRNMNIFSEKLNENDRIYINKITSLSYKNNITCFSNKNKNKINFKNDNINKSKSNLNISFINSNNNNYIKQLVLPINTNLNRPHSTKNVISLNK